MWLICVVQVHVGQVQVRGSHGKAVPGNLQEEPDRDREVGPSPHKQGRGKGARGHSEV